MRTISDAARRKAPTPKFAVELDGGGHGFPGQRAKDEKRNQFLGERGIKVLRFSDADAKKYLEIARDAGWEAVIKASPEHGPKLREYFTKKN